MWQRGQQSKFSVCVIGFPSVLSRTKPSERLSLSAQAYVFSKINAASAVRLSVSSKGAPPAVLRPRALGRKSLRVDNPARGPGCWGDPARALRVDEPARGPGWGGCRRQIYANIPLGTCHAPQTSPRSPSNDDLIRYHARPPIKSLLIISGRWPHARPPIGSSSVVAGCASLYIRLKVRHGPRDGNQVISHKCLCITV